MNTVTEQLFSMQDPDYRVFLSRLLPDTQAEVIGVRTPELKKLAKELVQQGMGSAFTAELPHVYFEEYQLHAFILSGIRDFDVCVEVVSRFLPYVDNWATCDQLSPKAFRKRRTDLLSHIRQWLASDQVYTVRFAIKMLMDHFLDEAFDAQYPKLVASVRSEEYYINMMRAWYFATGLAKQYDNFLPYIEEYRLDRWTHNKTIRKAVESYRITEEQKATLKTFRIRK